MDQETYKINPLLPIVGVVGFVFWTYLWLYNIGVTSWKPFPWSKDPYLFGTWGEIVFLVLLHAGSLMLIWTIRLKVTFDRTGVWYKGLVRSFCMRWEDIVLVNVYHRGTTVHLWTKQRHLEIPIIYMRQGDFKEYDWHVRQREQSGCRGQRVSATLLADTH